MKIGIIGLGSIGQRHMRNLLEMGESDLFAFDHRIGEKGFSCAPIQGTNSEDLFWRWKPEAVLICTPPDSHYRMISYAAFNKTDKVFVEKPVVHSSHYADLLTMCNESWKMTLAVGYQLRWQWENFHVNGINIVWECSQDMSQWPSQYQKDVLLEFSHEIDLAIYASGPVVLVTAIQSERGWQIRLAHLDSVSTIFINPRAESPAREAYIQSQHTANRIWKFSNDLNEQAYKNEMSAFLQVCRGGEWDHRLCTAAQAAHVVRIIDACKRSAKNCEVVEL